MDVIVISSDSDDSSPVFVFTPTKQPSCQLSRYGMLHYDITILGDKYPCINIANTMVC